MFSDSSSSKEKDGAMKKKILLLFLGYIVLLSAYLPAIETGEIQGKVSDENGVGLPGVEIIARSPGLQGTRTVLSTKSGEFRLPLLPVGSYALSFKLQGFQALTEKDVIVRLGRVTSLAVTMRLSEIKEEAVVTAEAPLIDKTSADTSYSLTSTDLEKVPAQNRTIVDMVKQAPGVTGVRFNSRRGRAIEGQPSFRGEGEEGNNWIVDGLSISGVRMKNSGVGINLDSIDEIQVISDSFSPEYGSAYGGIINMVTKSGSNDWSGEAALIFMDRNFQAGRRPQLSLISEPDFFSDYNGYFNIGGPLIKDKLWFFLSNNLYYDRQETHDADLAYLFVPGGEKTTVSDNIFAKLTYAINSNHNLSLTSVFQKSLTDKGGIGFPDLFEKRPFTDIVARLNYRGILNSSTFIEAGLGVVRRRSNIRPADGDLGPAQYYVQDVSRNLHNSYGDVTDNQNRLDFNVKLNKHLETETFGRHEFNLGFEYYSFSSEFKVGFSGRNEDPFPGNGFDNGAKYYFNTWQPGRTTPTILYEYGKLDMINSARGIGVYFRDKATFGRFTFMAGFRSQTQLCLKNNGEKMWSWGLGDFFSPRLTLTADLTGDGVNVLKLGWGRFSDLLTTLPLGLLSSGAGLAFRTYSWKGGVNPADNDLHNPANWEFKQQQKDQPFEIAKGLEPNFLTRILVEFDRRLGKDWAFKARFVHSNAEKLLEVLAVFDPITQYKFLYDNFEYKRRNYQGLEFELNGRIGPALFLNASYSHAFAKGTNPGQTETGAWDQEEGSSNYFGFFGNHLLVPNLPEYRIYKDYVDREMGGLGGRGIGDEGWYGKLPYSVDHDVKLNAFMVMPYGFILSTAFEWLSGYYWEKLGYVPFFGSYLSYPEGRGSRETPPHAYLDLGIEKDFTLAARASGRPMSLSVRTDIFNLLNSQQPLSYVKQDNLIFGQIWGRQQPRQARLMIRLKW
jgi:hypothetical protein